MARGKKDVADFIPAGTPETRSNDSTDENMSAVDLGFDFAVIVPVVLADPNEQ